MYKVHRSFSLALGLAFIAFFTSGCFLLPKEEVFVEPPLKAAPKVTYDLAEVKRGTIEKTLDCFGYFISMEQSDLSFKDQTGRLKKIYVNIGDAVEKGTLLAELDSGTLEFQLAQQEISINKMKLALDAAKKKSEADLKLARMQLEELKKQLGIYKALSDSTPEATIQDMENQIKQKEISIENMQVASNTGIKQSELDMAAAKLQYEKLKQELSRARLVSPITGVVDYVAAVKEGENIAPYQEIIRVADPTRLQVFYSGELVPEFTLGMTVSITVDDRTYAGKVVATPLDMPDSANEKMKKAILINVQDLPSDTDMGNDVQIHAVLAKKDNVIIIEKDLVHENGTRKFVRVLENNVKKERSVETGIENDTEIEIVKGLNVGDKVIR